MTSNTQSHLQAALTKAQADSNSDRVAYLTHMLDRNFSDSNPRAYSQTKLFHVKSMRKRRRNAARKARRLLRNR